MNLNDLLDKILTVARLSEEEIEKFKETYFKLLAARILEAVASTNRTTYEKLLTAPNESEVVSSEQIIQTLKEVSSNPGSKKEIISTFEEVSSELAEAVLGSLTHQERSQLLAALQ